MNIKVQTDKEAILSKHRTEHGSASFKEIYDAMEEYKNCCLEPLEDEIEKQKTQIEYLKGQVQEWKDAHAPYIQSQLEQFRSPEIKSLKMQVEKLTKKLQYCHNKVYTLYHSQGNKHQSTTIDLEKLWDAVEEFKSNT